MKRKIDGKLIDIEQKVFDIKNELMPRGAWWWWFWLFFFDNPKEPSKPQQLMILWSTKNVRKIECNNLKMRFNCTGRRDTLDGTTAAWYFDGEKMNHNFLLEQCNINVSNRELIANSTIPTSFSINKNKKTIRIGKDFKFIAEVRDVHDFTRPIYHSYTYFGNKGYSLLKLNRLNLKGMVKNKQIRGTAYFQRIFANAPTPSWYWGIFHFENGGILTYFNPYLFGKSIKKNISFFDGAKTHEFIDMNVTRLGEKMPVFTVSGKNEHEKINFTVNPYSHSSWIFRKKAFGIIPNKLIYNEYPAVISNLKLTNKKTGGKIILKDLGKSVGNVEHTTGFLL